MCIIKQTNLKLCEGVLWYLAARCQQEILQILQLTRWGLFAGSDFLVPTTAKEVLSMEAHICLIGLRLDHLEAKSTPKTCFCALQTTGEPFFSIVSREYSFHGSCDETVINSRSKTLFSDKSHQVLNTWDFPPSVVRTEEAYRRNVFDRQVFSFFNDNCVFVLYSTLWMSWRRCCCVCSSFGLC